MEFLIVHDVQFNNRVAINPAQILTIRDYGYCEIELSVLDDMQWTVGENLAKCATADGAQFNIMIIETTETYDEVIELLSKIK